MISESFLRILALGNYLEIIILYIIMISKISNIIVIPKN